jgi:hypothetical protein
MPTPFSIACIIDYVEFTRRELNYNAICHLISAQSSIIPLYTLCRRRVLLYDLVEFQLDNYTND